MTRRSHAAPGRDLVDRRAARPEHARGPSRGSSPWAERRPCCQLDLERDRQLIVAIYAERGRRNADGNLVYFSKNSKAVQDGVARRFVDEARDALRMLESLVQALRQAVPAVLWLSRPGTALPSDDIVGVYQYEGPVAATLEVRHEAGQYVVRLEGGGSAAEGPATAADCVVEARGDLDGVVLRPVRPGRDRHLLLPRSSRPSEQLAAP